MKKANNMFKAFRFILFIGVLLASMEFIPVKYSKTNTDGQSDKVFINAIFEYAPKTVGPNVLNWTQDDAELPDLVQVSGADPYSVLTNKDFNSMSLFDSGQSPNRFVFYGKSEILKNKIVQNRRYENVMLVDSDGWEIMYPIKRLSFRRHYVSKEYLTIYDYDWLKVIKQLCGRAIK